MAVNPFENLSKNIIKSDPMKPKSNGDLSEILKELNKKKESISASKGLASVRKKK